MSASGVHESGLTTIGDLATLCGLRLEGDASRVVTGTAPLAQATGQDIALLSPGTGDEALADTRAAALVVGSGQTVGRRGLNLLRSQDPYQAFLALTSRLQQEEAHPPPGVHPGACVHPEAKLGRGVHVGAGCVIGPGARIGRDSVLHPGVIIGAEAVVGFEAVLRANAVLYARVRLGNRCLIQAGAVLGAEGFVHQRNAAGGLERLPCYGCVVIEDDVDIGPTSTVERGQNGITRIGRGAKLGSGVHVGHDAEVGPGAKLVTQTGIASDVRVGKGACLMGQVGVRAGAVIGREAVVLAGSVVFGDVPARSTYLGYPARPHRESLQAMAAVRRLPHWFKQLARMKTQKQH